MKKNLLIGPLRRNLKIKISNELLPRAIKFMGALNSELESRGFQLKQSEFHRIVVIIKGIELPIRLREKCKRVIKNDNVWNSSELVPIGKLVFSLDVFPRKEWEDSKNKYLESKVTCILNYLEQKAQEEIAYTIDRKKREEQSEIRKQKIALIRQEKKREEKRYNQLIQACERFHQAKKIREYLEALQFNKSKPPQSDEFRIWLKWARNKLNELELSTYCIY